ncbi:sulfate adenylyltransferase subunit CysN [Pacificimonas sp. WHA3]|uniref:Multifunctional fusion protein n=1 Tax=Pacificimonas pallii TaxID=2827236 RepID=A0ABS6SHF8_9SPHN|nr:sulfate adenylyltransferase subunit CysN [Pacificimonas pallii]MBV7257857.1 sulfate adenylyltransferase subunit CysN [Pacificimonas pallii]
MTDQGSSSYAPDAAIAADILAYLETHENKDLLRFLTCGSVDDGKSTLIGRLLYDTKMIYEDQLAAVEQDSRRVGTTGEAPDLALLVDGLAAEREQGITIDVAYRFFSTEKRKFIVADTPGHEQYTRNMATGASTADVAIILIDARHGVQVQTRRHAFIASLLGIRHVAVAVNKMDLVDWSEARLHEIEAEFRRFGDGLGFGDITAIPMSALTGDNVTEKSAAMPWYTGPALLEYLETVDILQTEDDAPFRLPVQWVNRPNLDFRGFAGTVASGSIAPGDEIITIPSGKRSKVKSISTFDGDLPRAVREQAVTIVLEDEIDSSRGDIICDKDHPAEQSDQFRAKLLWMAEKELLPGRQYRLRTGNKTVGASVSALKHKVDVNDFSKRAGKTLELNEVGVCNLSLAQPIAFDPYAKNRRTGSFILIDRQTNETVGAGMLDFSLRRAANVVWQDLNVGRAERARQKHQRSAVLWFTGLSGSGKSTIANLVERRLYDMGRHTYILDGDNVRHGLNKDLGFTDADRVENIRRVSETAKLMADAGLITLVSFISPFRTERQIARGMMAEGEFIEIHVDTPLAVAEARDVKGLYAKARAGKIKNFTGIDSAYEDPLDPEIRVNTARMSAEDAAETIVAYLERAGFLSGE